MAWSIFVDLLQGPQSRAPAEQCGNLLLRDRVGNWTYQLAGVVDDWQQGIDLAIRGTDLLAFTGKSVWPRLLGRATSPALGHHPLAM